MRRWPFIFIALLVTLAFGCVSEPKPVVKDTAHFDARNRLLSAGGVTNVYDALNNRIGQTAGTNTTVYVVNPNAQLPQVLMRIKNGVTNYYVYGGGLLYQVTETAAGTNTLTYHYDYRGSTIALSSDSGLVTDRIEYSAYGLTTYRAGTSDTPFLFNGRYGVQSDANGLMFMQARYYNPYLCRFINPDPSGFGGGLNFYAYANGNPVSLIDPYGLGAIGESHVDLTWFNAPTPAQQEAQQILAGFVNLATLGVANLASSAINGTDLNGDALSAGDAFQQVEENGAFVASLALALPTDGGSLEAEAAIDGGLQGTRVAGAAETTAIKEGSFSVVDWSGYPAGVPKPAGPFRLLEGTEYDTARTAANQANNHIRIQQGLRGQQVDVHEIQPVKFDGSPTDPANKIILDRTLHRQQVNPWWNQLQRNITGN